MNINLDNELSELLRAFNIYNNDKLEYSIINEYPYITIILNYGIIYNNTYKLPLDIANYTIKSLIKFYAKRDFYRLLREVTRKKLPYGSLTGIRPTKLYYDLLERGFDAYNQLTNEYDVSIEKADLIKNTIDTQSDHYAIDTDKYNLFVNIPICPSRCSYCSFISTEISKCKGFIDRYIELLVDDIRYSKELAAKQGKEFRSVYVGGGTPTSISDESFARVLAELNELADEITVEAGRPDSITSSKLDIMERYGVSRISINPQSFNQITLDAIGRKHSIDDTYKAYEMSKEYGFDINMDLIAMLPDESLEDFSNSVQKTLDLKPDNITIHTLSIKKGSKLKEIDYDNTNDLLANSMIDYANNTLMNNNYKPYYMYRQKYTSGNLENVAYCLKGKQCKYNIDIMEETHSILACGAGAISKRVGDTIERIAFAKDLTLYIERFNELMKKRLFLFSN